MSGYIGYTTTAEIERVLRQKPEASVWVGFIPRFSHINEVIIVQVDHFQGLYLVGHARREGWEMTAYETVTGSWYLFFDEASAAAWALRTKKEGVLA